MHCSYKLKHSLSVFYLLLFLVCAMQAEASFTSGKPSSITIPNDAFAGVLNPAGEVWVGDRFDVGFTWFNHRERAKISGNAVPIFNGSYNASKKNNFFFPSFAVAKQFNTQIKSKIWEWALGFMYYNKIFIDVKYGQVIPAFGTTHYSHTTRGDVLSGVWSFKLGCHHSFGVSLDFNIVATDLFGVENFQSRSIFPNHFTNTGTDYAYGLGTTWGWRWEPVKQLIVGLTYEPKTYMSKFGKYKGVFPNHGQSNFARRIGGGIAVIPVPRLSLGVDIKWINYEGVQIGNRLLNSQGTMNPIGSYNSPLAGWRNIFVFTYGARFTVSDYLTLRAAYIHEQQKMPRSQTLFGTTTCDAVRDSVVGQATVSWLCHELSVLYSHGFKNTIKGHNSIPPFFAGGEVDVKRAWDRLSVSWGYKY